MTEEELQGIEAQIQRAQSMVSALCLPRGSEGSREWVMSIPARPDHDPDLVVGGGLRGKERLIAEVRRQRSKINETEVALAEYRAWCDAENITEHRAIARLETKTTATGGG